MRDTVSSTQSTPASAKDMAGSTRSFLLYWGIPIAVLVLSGFADGGNVNLFAWPPALAWMGIACLHNARQCGRLHCYITGPYFLVMALLSVLHGLDILPLGPTGWSWIGAATAIGGIGLTFVPEWIWGRYVRR